MKKAWEKIKKAGYYLIIAVFWLSIAATFIYGCIGTFIKSSDEPQEDYEEYLQSTIP